MRTLFVLAGPKSGQSDRNFADLVSFLGADVEMAGSWEQPAGATPSAIALHAETLSASTDCEENRPRIRQWLASAPAVLVYGARAGVHDEAVKWVSGGAFTAVVRIGGADHGQLPAQGRSLTGQMAGGRFARPGGAQTTDVIVSRPACGALPLMTVNGEPTFLCVRQPEGSTLFVTTVDAFPNPRQPVADEQAVAPLYDALLPLMIFVRAACGEWSWHGGWHGARLIIDDPVLRTTYGCLDFRRLLDSVQQQGYGATVAYIPWNQARTSERVASFFNRAGDRFSLTVHGCDHTNKEYGSTDEEYLRYKSTLAMERMRRHQARTGMGFEPIMVFPQGLFSTAALRSLRSSGFLAAVNTTRFPLDAEAAPTLLADVLRPAVTRPDGFPVFLRHYPTDAFALLFDLFLGRPAVIVEHHAFFKDGFPAIEELVGQLNAAQPNLSWGPLAETLEKTCWQRTVSPGRRDVRFFAGVFKITNSSDRRIDYRLIKDEPNPAALSAVFVNGAPAPTSRDGSDLVVELALDPSETACVRLLPVTSASSRVRREGHVYAGKVFLRRTLSEFRDEVLVKHPTMLAWAKRVARWLKTSPDSTAVLPVVPKQQPPQ